jgi:CDP-glucose 4,6-dehydratase
MASSDHRRHPRSATALRAGHGRGTSPKSYSISPRSAGASLLRRAGRDLRPTSWARSTCSRPSAQTPGVRAVVVVTSDKCYENREAYRSSFFNPADHAHHGTALATARAGNAIGGGDWSANRLIPDAMRAFAEQRPLQVRHPGAIRPWQHVLDPLAGYLLLAEHLFQQGPAVAEAWNFGPADGNTHSVAQVLEKLISIWGEGAAWSGDQSAHPPEAHSLRLDASQAISALRWRPRWSLDSALRMTVAWHRAHARGECMATISRQQINSYCQAAGSTVVT